MSNAGKDARRSFLVKFVGGVSALFGAAIAGLLGAVATPRTIAAAKRWRRATGSLDPNPERPITAVLTERHEDGWYETTKQSVVFIDRDASGYRALSAICQHLGCRVHWDDTKQQFLCPCHGGVYDREGRVVSGPPPRPLQRLNVRVDPATSDVEVEL